MSKTGKFTEAGFKTAEMGGTGSSRLMSKGLGTQGKTTVACF